MSQNVKIEVKPTGNKGGAVYTDTALTNVFIAHVTLLNSERQTIWQRYNVMLLANSLVITFLTRTDSALETLFGVIFGLVLCCVWFEISKEGWKVFKMYEEAGMRFYWTEFAESVNPLKVHGEYEGTQSGGNIFKFALDVIWIFIGAYILLGLIRFVFI